MARNIKQECNHFLEAIEYVHNGEPCAEDIAGEWCAKCVHLEPQARSLLQSVSRWQVRLAETILRFKLLGKLVATYIPWRGRNAKRIHT